MPSTIRIIDLPSSSNVDLNTQLLTLDPANNITNLLETSAVINYITNSLPQIILDNTIVQISRAAYGQANSAYGQANAAYNQANTGITVALNSYARANSSYNQANSAYIQANTGITVALNAYAQANAAYNQANSGSSSSVAYGQANAAYNQANTALFLANSAYNAANTITLNTNLTNIKTFGAVGDGVTDDFAAIQNAANTGLGIYFPQGVYNCSGKITSSNTHFIFIGESRQTSEIRFISSSNTNQGFYITVANSEFIRIENLRITTNTNYANTKHAIHIDGTNNLIYTPAMPYNDWLINNRNKRTQLKDLFISGADNTQLYKCWESGIRLTSVTGSEITNLHVVSDGNRWNTNQPGVCSAIRIDGKGYSVDHHINNITASLCKDLLFLPDYTEGVKINNFEAVGCRYGIRAEYTLGESVLDSANCGHLHLVVSSGHLNCQEESIKLGSASNSIPKLNNIYINDINISSGNDGFAANSAIQLTNVLGSVIRDCTIGSSNINGIKYGIKMDGSDRNQIHHNQIYFSANGGIGLSNTCDNNIIDSNYVFSANCIILDIDGTCDADNQFTFNKGTLIDYVPKYRIGNTTNKIVTSGAGVSTTYYETMRSIKSFGDTSGDCRAVIQEAANTGLPIFFPAGQYSCSGKIYAANSDFCFIGAGPNISTIVFINSDITQQGFLIKPDTAFDYIKLEGLSLITQTSNTNSVAFELNGQFLIDAGILPWRNMSKFIINNVSIAGFNDSINTGWGTGIKLNSFGWGNINDYSFEGDINKQMGNAIELKAQTSSNFGGLPLQTKINNINVYNSYCGILCPDWYEDIHLTNFDFRDVSFGIIGRYYPGQSLLPESNTEILNLIVDSGHILASNTGIQISKVVGGTISKVNMDIHGSYNNIENIGVFANACANMILSDNKVTIDNSVEKNSYGIKLHGADRNLIHHNTLYFTANGGIAMENACSLNIIDNNYAYTANCIIVDLDSSCDINGFPNQMTFNKGSFIGYVPKYRIGNTYNKIFSL